MNGPYQRKSQRRIFGAVLAVLAMAGCSVVPVYKAPGFPFAKSFSRSSAPILLDNAAWWKRFDDPVLNRLVETALRGNLDLKIARERVTEARARTGTVPLAAGLTGSVSAEQRSTTTFAESTTTATEGGAEASFGFGWLFDPYGGRKALQAAAAARVEVADAELDAARLLLLSSITTTYIDLRYSQRALQLRQQELQSRRRTLRLVRDLTEGKLATRLDLIRAEALVSETQGLIPPLQAAAQIRSNEIAVLLGLAPGAANMVLGGAGGQPQADLPAEIGIPADLLRNRPDIRIAERMYYAAVADIGVAKADLYPTLSLGGTITLSTFNGPVTAATQFGPSLRLPALPDSPRRATVAVRESRASQAHATWASQVLGAIRDVESALAEYAGSLASVQASRQTVRLYSEAVELTREQIARDGATIRDLLDAEQSVAAARIALAQNLRELGQNFVVLNVGLGSGNGYEP